MTTETRPALRYEGFVDGIDVSSVQIITDAAAVAAEGFVFATVKASEGVNYCDPRALEHLAKLRDAGLVCSVYTFLRPSQGNPRAQVSKAFECAGDVFPMRLLLDLEGAPDGMPSDELVGFGEEAADAALEHGVLEAEFYSYPDFIHRRLMPALARSSRLARCPLHIAHYLSNTEPRVPPPGWKPFVCAPWSTWTKHQYSGNGGYRVKGIAGDVDRNLFNGDLTAFRRYMGLEGGAGADDAIIHPAVELVAPEPKAV